MLSDLHIINPASNGCPVLSVFISTALCSHTQRDLSEEETWEESLVPDSSFSCFLFTLLHTFSKFSVFQRSRGVQTRHFSSLQPCIRGHCVFLCMVFVLEAIQWNQVLRYSASQAFVSLRLLASYLTSLRSLFSCHIGEWLTAVYLYPEDSLEFFPFVYFVKRVDIHPP